MNCFFLFFSYCYFFLLAALLVVAIVVVVVKWIPSLGGVFLFEVKENLKLCV